MGAQFVEPNYWPKLNQARLFSDFTLASMKDWFFELTCRLKFAIQQQAGPMT
jgi:hypothetical protein